MKTVTKEQKCIKKYQELHVDEQYLEPFNKINQEQKPYTRWETVTTNKATHDIKMSQIQTPCT